MVWQVLISFQEWLPKVNIYKNKDLGSELPTIQLLQIYFCYVRDHFVCFSQYRHVENGNPLNKQYGSAEVTNRQN